MLSKTGPVALARVGRLGRAHLLPPTRIGRQLAAVSLLDSFGTGMYYTGSALYFTLVVGLSAGQVGLGLSLGGLIGLAGSVPVGMLADRIRAGKVYIGLQVIRAACYAAYCLVDDFAMFALLAAVIGLTDAAIAPVHQAVVGAVVSGPDRIDTLAKIRAVRNIGFGLGALVATASIAQGSRAAFLVLIGGNAVSFLITAVLLSRIGIGAVSAVPAVGPAGPVGPVGPAGRAGVPRPRRSANRPRLVADLRYLQVAALSGVLAVHTSLLAIAVPLWFARHTMVPPVLIGVLIALNTVLAVLLQARFARPCADLPGAARGAVWAGLALAGFALVALGAHLVHGVALAIALAVIAVVLLTFGELWHSASSWTLSYELADPHRRTAYLSTFQLGSSLQAVLAPWVITTVVFGSSAGWVVLALVTMLAGGLCRVVLAPMLRPSRARHRSPALPEPVSQ